MKISRRAFCASIAAAGSSSLISSFPAPALAKNENLKIGLLVLATSSGTSVGQCGLRGVQWAAERINREGGIAGRKVDLVIDEETTPEKTIERFKRLLQEKVDCVQGVVQTNVSLALAPLAEKTKSLLILWDGTTQNGVKDTMPEAKYVFKPTDNECEAVMSSLLTVKYYEGQFKTIAGMNPDYSYGRNTWEAFKQILRRYGIQYKVVAERWPKLGSISSELAPHVEALKAAKPDLIFSSMLQEDLVLFMRQAHANGLSKSAKFVLPDGGWQINQLSKAVVPEGTVFGWKSLYFANPNASKLQREFVDFYLDRYKEVPHSEADCAYFCLAAYKAGVEAAYNAKHKWPSATDIAEAIPGKKIETLGGIGRFRDDRIAEVPFYEGLSTNKNSYNFPTLSTVETLPASALQKQTGDEFWDWIKTAPFPV